MWKQIWKTRFLSGKRTKPLENAGQNQGASAVKLNNVLASGTLMKCLDIFQKCGVLLKSVHALFRGSDSPRPWEHVTDWLEQPISTRNKVKVLQNIICSPNVSY